jgi:hypothetical protein
MIDWYSVFTNSLWILGLSIILAAFSWQRWEAGERGRRLAEQFREPAWEIALASGLVLVSLGLLLAESTPWWERAAWALLGGAFGWHLWFLLLRGGRAPAASEEGGPGCGPR